MKWTAFSMPGMVAAVFLLPASLTAGDRVRSPSAPPARSPSVSYAQRTYSPYRGASTQVTVSVASPTPSEPAPETGLVALRGPDGQVRRFAVEGGLTALQSPQVVIIRPGQSVTIRWAAAK
jgi:hypothetical protein